jgi:hypothetical protein
MRQDYRRITLGFAVLPPSKEFDMRLPGVQHIQTHGRQIIVLANRNTEAIVERARSLEAISVDVSPVSLRELFLETVKGE